MKKDTVFIIIFFFILAFTGVCYAGDVPEALLHTDGAQLFFGKVTELTDTSITILPLKRIKGEVEPDKAITYSQKIYGWKPQVGKTYLFGYIDENNLYFWVADSMDPKTLKLKDANGMDLRLQEYLNNGEFEKAEEARQNKAAATAASFSSPTIAPEKTISALPSMPATTDSSLPVIAGVSEKPTSIRLSMIIALLAGAVLAVVVLILVVTGRKRNSSKNRY